MQDVEESGARPWGYQALLERYKIQIPRPYHRSWVLGSRRVLSKQLDGEDELFPASYGKDDSDLGQLIFALKYDGIELLALRKIFAHIDREELVQGIMAKRTSGFLRRLWFFFEFFEDFGTLDVENCPTCPSVDLADPKRYLVRNGSYFPRQRIRFNLLGNKDWCPMVRRSAALEKLDAAELRSKAQRAVAKIPRDTIKRAVRYLHTKETRASYEIESDAPQPRAQRFVEALINQSQRNASWKQWWTAEQFVEVQKELLDERYASETLRDFDVRVSEQLSLTGKQERVHWVGAPRAYVQELLRGLSEAWKAHHMEPRKPRQKPQQDEAMQPRDSCGDPNVDLAMAVCLSFGFVYVHPFGDGNGRVHRLLLSYVFAQTQLTPPDIVVPISALVLNDRFNYDRILESYSRPAMACMRYEISPQSGEISVSPSCADLFRYIDLSDHVEQIAIWFEQAIHEELVREVEELVRIDEALGRMQEIVDMPDQKLHRFLQICHHNGSLPGSTSYRIPKKKRQRLFAELSDAEVASLEEAVSQVFSRGEEEA